jgi:hypothetical protein
MTKLPVKVLLDENKKPFVPYMNTDTVFYGDTDKTVSETLDEAVAEVSDLANAVDELAKEVAAKIETVFTYKGNVTNYNALQQIVDPNVGDVYNVLDTDKNYAWSGSKWDDLGGIVDLSDYCTEDRMLYIIEEHSKILGDMLTNQMNNALLEYYTKDETEKLVNDALSNAEVSVDLSDYYTKEEVDVRIPNINTTTLLKAAGHVDTVEELPSVSQPSGEFGEHPSVLDTDLTLTNVTMPNLSDLPNLQTIQGTKTPYVFGFYIDEDNFFFVSADKPENINGFSYSLDGHFIVYTNKDSTPENIGTTIGHGKYNGIKAMDPMIGNDDGVLFIQNYRLDAYYSGDNTSILATLPLFANPEPGLFMHYLGGKGPVRIFGNLPTTVEYRPHLPRVFKKIGPDPMLERGYELIPEDATRDSLTLAFKNNYTYTEGMKALRFDEQGNAYWITDADGAKENDVATVGDNNDIYVNEPDKGWTPWAKPKDIDTSAFLKPKGFVNSEADLPSMGQLSGTQDPNYSITATVDITQNTDTIPDAPYAYKFGIVNTSKNAYLYVATNHPETIEAIAIGGSESFNIRINPTPEKPVAVYSKYYNRAGVYWMPDSFTGYYKARDNQKSDGATVSEPGYITGLVGLMSEVTVFGNLPTAVKYMKHDSSGYARTSTSLSGYTYNEISNCYGYSYTLGFNEDYYTYNEGMQMLSFDENYKAYWVLADPQEEPNSMYLVGPKNEQYVSTTDGWVHVSNHDSYTKAEIDAMLGEIESVLDNILNGG